jgi:uncharacterized repeat protein (TIGR01451 family)
MNKGYAITTGLILLALGAAAASAQAPLLAANPALAAARPAPKAGCIELRSVAETEELYRDDKGQQAMRRVPAAKVVPGTQVIWTLSATNVCSAAADKVFIDNPVPEHMALVADSVRATGADISYSLDGKQFAAPEQLRVAEADGTTRQARTDEYTHVRWAFRNSIGPGQLAAASFRATVR